MITINNRFVRFLIATILAFGSLFWAAPAQAETLQEAQEALVVAQQELSDAAAALEASRTALDEAAAAYLATAQGGTVTENFDGVSVTTATQFLIEGSSPITTTGTARLQNYNYSPNVTGGTVFFDQNSSQLQVIPSSPASSLSFYSAAKNGDQPVYVTFDDGSSSTFTNPNGVGNPECPNYECLITYSAPEGKLIEFIVFPSSGFDIWLMDGISFITTTYDPALYQDYLTAQSNFNTSQASYDAAVAEVARLEQLIIDLTPHLNAPSNLVVTLTDAGVDLVWDAPTPHTSGVSVERYAIFWSTTNFTQNGWAWSHDQTNVSIPLDVLNSAGGLGNNFQFKIRADNDSQSVYSGWSNTVEIQVDAPAIEQWWDLQWDENATITLTADAGYVFDSATAWYGTPSNTCGLDVSSIVTNLISGKDSISFVANNQLFTDPCPGWGKVLRFSATLSQVSSPETESPTAGEGTPGPTQPEPTPQPETTPQPLPTTPSPEPTPIPEPTLDPTPIIPETPAPEQPVEIPDIIEETPEEETVDEQPVTEPEQEPVIPSEEEPASEPSPSEEPTKEPEEIKPTPLPEPESPETPEPREPELPVEEEPELSVEESVELISELADIDPTDLTTEQVEQLVEAAMQVFESAEQGSPEYEAALDALMIAAEADDLELPAELAAIPLIGNVAGAVLEVFNDLGNLGADMSPEMREKSEKVIIASVIVGQVAMAATTAAATSAAMAARRP